MTPTSLQPFPRPRRPSPPPGCYLSDMGTTAAPREVLQVALLGALQRGKARWGGEGVASLLRGLHGLHGLLATCPKARKAAEGGSGIGSRGAALPGAAWRRHSNLNSMKLLVASTPRRKLRKLQTRAVSPVIAVSALRVPRSNGPVATPTRRSTFPIENGSAKKKKLKKNMLQLETFTVYLETLCTSGALHVAVYSSTEPGYLLFWCGQATWLS